VKKRMEETERKSKRRPRAGKEEEEKKDWERDEEMR
jgi:hypothetical protein